MSVREWPYHFRRQMLAKRQRPPTLPPEIQVESRCLPDDDLAYYDEFYWGKFADQPGDPDRTVQVDERKFYTALPPASLRAARCFWSNVFGMDRHTAWLKSVQDLRKEAQTYDSLGCTWNYVGVWVGLIYHGELIAETTLWGVESFATDYIAQVKRDLQDQLWAAVLPSLFYAYA